eukprot:12709431-Alexandrium_andersonii.AAC.1
MTAEKKRSHKKTAWLNEGQMLEHFKIAEVVEAIKAEKKEMRRPGVLARTPRCAKQRSSTGWARSTRRTKSSST